MFDKLEGLLDRTQFTSLDLWRVVPPRNEERLLQTRQENPFRNDANHILLLKLGERATNRLKFQTEKISDILTSHR